MPSSTQPPPEFVLADEAALETGQQSILLAGGRVRLDFPPVTGEFLVHYRPLAHAPELSPFGIAFDLLAEPRQPGSAAHWGTGTITMTVDIRDLVIPFGADAEGRVAVYLADPVQDRLASSEATPEEVTGPHDAVSWLELPRQVDAVHKTITIQLPRLGQLLLATAAASADGDFAVQPTGDLKDYQVGLYMGSAQATYSFPVPAGQAGPSPDLALTYDSAGVDGMHTNKNNQPPWTGIGWNLGTGYIVRRMVTCNSAQAPGDLCLANSEYHLVLNGVSSRLIDMGSGQFKLQSDPYWKVTRLTSANPNHPDTNKEYWQVTTPDGTRYRFGAEFEAVTSGSDLDSAFFVPVYDLSVCAADTYRVCNKVWQWNLDRVEDTNGNVITFFYNQETNYYSARTFIRRLYVRAGNPARIEYTKRANDNNVLPTAKVEFFTENRCIDACLWPTNYPDTPGDLQCGATGTCTKSYPSFWSKLKLSRITTFSWANNTWQDVNRWDLAYSFPTPPPDGDGDISQKKMELTSITRRTPDGVQGLPPTTYTYTWLKNRNNHPAGVSPMYMSRLSQVTNELGGSVGFSYASDCPTTLSNNIRPPYDCFVAWDPYTGSGGWVIWRKYKVTQQVWNDGLSNPPRITTFSYTPHVSHYYDDNRLPAVNGACPGGGSNCAKDYWFDTRGYNIVTVSEADGSYHEHRFFRGMHGDRLGVSGGTFSATVARSDGTTLTDSNWLRGREYEVRTFAAGGTLLTRQVTDYYATLTAGSGPDGAYFVAPAAVSTWTYDANGANPRQTRATFTYDSYGNVIGEVHAGDTATPTDDRLIDRAFFANTTAYIVDRPAWERLFAGSLRTANGTEKAMTAYAYDGLAFFSGTPTTGNQTAVARYHTISASYTDPGNYDVTAIDYDDYGRPTVMTDANNHSTTTTYHPVYGYATTVTNALGQATMTQVDPGTGNVLSLTDPNGAITAHEYDAFGRLVKTWQPGETQGTHAPTVEVTYTLGSANTPSLVHARQREDLGGASSPAYLESWRFFDGAGRLIQQQGEGDTGSQVIVRNRVYDIMGQLARESVPYLEPTAPGGYLTPNWSQPATHYTYDGLGRITQVTHTDGSAVVTSYDRWTRSVVDENGHRRSDDSDAFGQLAQVREYSGTVPAVNLYATTNYAYDVLGNLTAITDTAGITTTMTYDPLGRKTAMHDPDMGNWQYGYDAVGNLLRQVDARGQVTCSYYDEVNRLQGKHYRSDTNCPATIPAFTGQDGIMASYGYDEAGSGASLGRRTRADVYQANGALSNRATWTYDLRGRTTQETRTIDGSGGGTFTTAWGYDAADRQRWMQYPGTPAVEQVDTEYTARGLVAGVSASGIDYVQDTVYDEAGRVLQRGLGSLPVLRTSYWYYGWTEPNGRGRVGTISTHKLSAPTGEVQSLHYGYDAGGNVSQVSFQTPDPEATIARGFQYDALDRLTRVNWMSPGTPYLLESYAYSETGNLVVRSSGGTAYDYTYGTQADDCPDGALTKVHAVVAATTPTYGPATYCYDQNGNLRRQVIGEEKVFAFAYDSENHLVTISGDDAATYVYDADGQRVKASFGNAPNVTTVVYMGSHFEQRTAGSTVSTTKYYFAGNVRVAMRTQTGTSDVLHWLLSDTLGSTTTAVGANGELVASAFYEAWGEITPVFGDLPTARRYTGQLQDPLIAGIYYYNARYYDPALGRFLQADTIVPQPGNPQSLNRYSYVLNNALRYTDPSGHAVCEDMGCTRVLNPRTGRLMRIRAPQIDWAGTTTKAREMAKFITRMMISAAKGKTVALLQARNTQCFSCKVPSTTLGWAELVKADVNAHRLALISWGYQVCQGCAWDPKPLLQKEFGENEEDTYITPFQKGGHRYYYDVWGNIMFGYLGKAAGFDEGELLDGAGVEQIGSSIGSAAARLDPSLLPKPTSGAVWPRAWDDPSDQVGAQLGFELWDTYDLTITPMDLIEVIKRSPGLTTYPPQ